MIAPRNHIYVIGTPIARNGLPNNVKNAYIDLGIDISIFPTAPNAPAVANMLTGFDNPLVTGQSLTIDKATVSPSC